MPIGKTVLNMVVRAIPSPQEAQATRMDVLAHDIITPPPASLSPALLQVRQGMVACDAGSPSVVVFVSKMFCVPGTAVPPVAIPGPGGEPVPVPVSVDGAGDVFIAFARVLSGVLRPDTPLYVLGPKYSPKYVRAAVAVQPGPADTQAPSGLVLDLDNAHVARLTTPVGLYVMMGRELLPMAEASAGMVVGITNLSEFVMKTATLCTTPACPSLSSLRFQVRRLPPHHPSLPCPSFGRMARLVWCAWSLAAR
jgi:ribosome assembly protein 1